MRVNKTDIVNYSILIIGNLLVSFSYGAFLIPNSIITGGMGGIAIIIEDLFNFSPAILIGILSWSFFLLGYFILGKTFALKTLMATFIFPIGVFICEEWPYILEQTGQMENWVICIVGAVMLGSGMALVFKVGASTGGVDIIAYILKRKFKNIKLSTLIMIIDLIIIALGIMVINLNSVMVGLIISLIAKLVTDHVMLGGINDLMVQIITNQKDEILEFIHNDLGRGSTLITAQGGYTKQDSSIIQVLISKEQFDQLRDKIKEIDINAFIVIINASNVLGYGFKDIQKH